MYVCTALIVVAARQVSEIFRTPWLLSESSAAHPRNLPHTHKAAAQLPRNTRSGHRAVDERHLTPSLSGCRFIKAVQLTVESLHTPSNNIRSHLLTALSGQVATAAGNCMSYSRLGRALYVPVCICVCAGAGSDAAAGRRSSSASRGSFLQSIATAKVKLLDTLKDARVMPSCAAKELKVTTATGHLI